jgi:hypothetical protein
VRKLPIRDKLKMARFPTLKHYDKGELTLIKNALEKARLKKLKESEELKKIGNKLLYGSIKSSVPKTKLRRY